MYKFNKINNLRIRIEENKSKVTEEEVRLAINNDIEMIIKEKFNKEIHFKAEEKLKNNRRRVDSAYGNFIIEYKKPMVKLQEKEIEQLVDYLDNFGLYSKKEEVWGVLTNGIEIITIVYNSRINSFDIDESKSGKLNNDKILDICNELASIRKITLNKNTINDYLGIESSLKIKNILSLLFNYINESTNDRTLLLYNEWERLIRLSSEKDSWNEDKAKNREINNFYEEVFGIRIVNNFIQYKCLFVIQTYYSIIVKLVLYKYLKKKHDKSFNDYRFKKDLFNEIESSQFYKDHNILNLIDGDFYSWYVYELKEADFKLLYELVEDIETIDTSSLNETLITFYENIFPFQVRYAMGEYYTPNYLAVDVIDNAFKLKNNNVESILDPTCGSGVFLANIYKSNYSKKIYGIDINPLAVLTAKASLVLNNYNLNKPTEIPIYLGDSTYSPVKVLVDGVYCYSYDYLTFINDLKINVTLPLDLINEETFFDILDSVEHAIKNKNFHKSLLIIKSYKSSHFNTLKKHYESLINQLIELEKNKLNSIWLKIIGNYFIAASINNVDLIIGNPPWVRWSNLPTNYKNEIRRKCKVDGLFSNDKNSGGIDLNIAALIAYVCIRDRLKESGLLAFLMPDSLLTNKSFEGFRNMQVENKQFYLKRVIRWNGKEKPFFPVSIKFCEYFFTFDKNEKTEVFDKKLNKTYFMVKSNSSFNNNFICQSKSKFNKIIGKNELKFHKGIGLPKGGYFLLEFKENINKEYASFYYYRKIGARLKKSNKVIKLEKEIIYPFIRTTLINNNEILSTDLYCIFPYPFLSKEPYSLEYIRKKFPEFYKFLNKSFVQDSIDSASTYNQRIQKVNNNIGIFRVGEYTFGKHFIVFRDNTKASVAKVSWLKTDWGESKMPIFDGHVTFLSQNEKGNFLKKNERDKLYEIFINKKVQEFILNSADERSISSRLWNLINIK